MKNNAKSYRKIVAVIGIALIVVGIMRTRRGEDGKNFADQWKVRTIDVPGAMFGTQPLGINSEGDIVGYYRDSSFKLRGFLLIKSGFTNIDVPGAAEGTVPGDIVKSCGWELGVSSFNNS
jgi:hypothetical protein